MSPTKYLDMEIRDRKKYSLPPMCNLITIEGKGESLSGLKNRIEREFPTVRAHLSSDSHEITLLADNAEQGQLISSLKALQKVRSVKKMQLLKIVRNPINI
jgi:primosomal protein N'